MGDADGRAPRVRCWGLRPRGLLVAGGGLGRFGRQGPPRWAGGRGPCSSPVAGMDAPSPGSAARLRRAGPPSPRPPSPTWRPLGRLPPKARRSRGSSPAAEPCALGCRALHGIPRVRRRLRSFEPLPRRDGSGRLRRPGAPRPPPAAGLCALGPAARSGVPARPRRGVGPLAADPCASALKVRPCPPRQRFLAAAEPCALRCRAPPWGIPHGRRRASFLRAAPSPGRVRAPPASWSAAPAACGRLVRPQGLPRAAVCLPARPGVGRLAADL